MRETNEAEMKEYLRNHFRYWTMSGWNKSTSYARNIKIYNVIPAKYQDKAYQLMAVDEYWDSINGILSAFDVAHKHEFQIASNGRSGGYLVMYCGGINKDGGVYCYPGRSIDKYMEEFTDEDWDGLPLEERYKLVKEFDAVCDEVIETTINFCKEYNVVEKEIHVPKIVKVLKEV